MPQIKGVNHGAVNRMTREHTRPEGPCVVPPTVRVLTRVRFVHIWRKSVSKETMYVLERAYKFT